MLYILVVLTLVWTLAGGRKRLRREIRSLPVKEWKTVVAAMHVMKVVPQEVGLSIYGRHFRSYDSLVLQHSQASLHGPGDAAHFSEVFPIFHRAWTLAFENSLMAIDPSILGLPYWNFALDQDPSSGATSAFSSQYFGGSGDVSLLFLSLSLSLSSPNSSSFISLLHCHPFSLLLPPTTPRLSRLTGSQSLTGHSPTGRSPTPRPCRPKLSPLYLVYCGIHCPSIAIRFSRAASEACAVYSSSSATHLSTPSALI